MHVHRPCLCKFLSSVAQSPCRRCSSRQMKCCTRRRPSARRWLPVVGRAGSMRKPNPIVRQTNSTVRCCSRVRRHSSPSIRLFDSTLTPFQAESCRNSEQRCSSTPRCSSDQVEWSACRSSPMPANFPPTHESSLVASTAICRSAASQVPHYTPQERPAADQSDNTHELFKEGRNFNVKSYPSCASHNRISSQLTEQQNRIGMGEQSHRQLQEALCQACIADCNQAST